MYSADESALLSRQKNVTPISVATSRILINDPPLIWKDEVIAILNSFVQEEFSWDGYRGQPVSFETAHFSLKVLESVGQNIPKMPVVTLGSSGDLQYEWECESRILEVHVRAPNDVCVYRSNEASGEEEEVLLRNNFLILSEWLKWLSEDGRGIAAAAN